MPITAPVITSGEIHFSVPAGHFASVSTRFYHPNGNNMYRELELFQKDSTDLETSDILWSTCSGTGKTLLDLYEWGMKIIQPNNTCRLVASYEDVDCNATPSNPSVFIDLYQSGSIGNGGKRQIWAFTMWFTDSQSSNQYIDIIIEIRNGSGGGGGTSSSRSSANNPIRA